MWKDFFYYSKGERRAVYVLSLLIVFFAVGSFVLPQLKEKSKTSTVMDQEDTFSENIRIKEEKDTNKEGYTRVPIYEVQLKEFDPNTADSMDFLRLGLKPFVASNIMKYRAKKGKFRTSEDFSRVYGMTDEQFVQLKPYIRISDEFVDKSGLLRKDIVKQFDLRRLQDFLRFGNFCLTMVIMYATITPEFGKKGESRYVEQRVCHCECNLP